MSFICGFYKELEELKIDSVDASFGFLENLRVTGESSAFNFLHGSCADFAAMLSDVFGYEIECVRNADGRLIHAYCVSYIGDEKAYIDIRGITTDPELFFSEFSSELSYYSPTGEILVLDEDGFELPGELEIWRNKEAGFDGEFEDWEDPEIIAFIKDYGSYYDTDRYISIYKCKACDSAFEVEDRDWFECYGEEDLWGHIQLDHPVLFEEYQNIETPDMLELCYEHCVVTKCAEIYHTLPGGRLANGTRLNLDDIVASIQEARGASSSRSVRDAYICTSPDKETAKKSPSDPISR